MSKKQRIMGHAVLLASFLLLAGWIASPLEAQSLDIRFGRYTDRKEFFVGAGLLSAITNRFYFNPNVEYITVSKGTQMTFNLDFHLDFYTVSPVFFWLGAGLAVLYNNPQGPVKGKTDFGANLLFGLGIRTHSSLVPYVQGKVILADNDEFAFGVGLRF